MVDTIELRGGPLAKQVRAGVAADAAAWRARGVTPRMAAVIASEDPAVRSYAESKQRTATKLGIELDLVGVPPASGQDALEEVLADLSTRAGTHGVLLELPVSAGMDPDRAMAVIAPIRDVDGLTSANLGLVLARREHEAITPATPQACIELAESLGPVAGRLVGLVGRGRTVGRPMAAMLINRDATITVCHTKTPDLAASLAPCDIVMVAAGRAGLITGEHLRPGQVVIDAGINVVGDDLVGDVDRASVEGIASAITPVPGGVGPLTTAIVFRNLLRALALQEGPLEEGGSA